MLQHCSVSIYRIYIYTRVYIKIYILIHGRIIISIYHDPSCHDSDAEMSCDDYGMSIPATGDDDCTTLYNHTAPEERYDANRTLVHSHTNDDISIRIVDHDPIAIATTTTRDSTDDESSIIFVIAVVISYYRY